MKDEDHLRRALTLAAEHSADGRHGPFGSVVVMDGVVVGEGWNQVVSAADATAHAEVVAIRDACRRLGTHDLSGAALYASCEPCPMCLSAIYWARIGRVVYAASAKDAQDVGFDDFRILQELEKGWGERQVQGIQALREEGRAVLGAWLRNPDRVPY